MNDNFKVYLQAIIDDSSLSKVQKDLAKKKLEIQADINFSNFAKNKADIEKQFQSLAGIIKNILGDAVSDKQATQWAKQYYKAIESGANEIAKTQEGYYKRIIENTKQIYSLKNKLINADVEQTAEINKQLKALEQRNKYNYSQLDKKGLSDDGWERQVNNSKVALENQLKINQAKQIDIANSKTLASINDKSREIQLSIDTEKYSTQINTFKQQLSKFGTESGELFNKAQISLKQLESAYNGMKSTDGDKRVEYEKEYQKSLETTKNLLTQIKSQKSNELISSGDIKRQNFIVELNNYLSKNTAMTKQSHQEIIRWINTLESADDITRGTFENIKAEFKGLDTQLRQTNKLGLSWTDKFKQAVEKFGGWALATGSVMELWNQIRRIPSEVIKVNSAMTELYKVSDASAYEIDKYFEDATVSAKKYGAAITDVINATADWSRLGYSLADAKELAEIAVLYKNVGDGIDIDTASKSLVSTLQGFQLDADDALNIIDQFNEVANNFPINSAGIGEALQRSAASFYAANTDLSKSIALITGTNAVVQDPTTVGTMWKTVSMRIRGAKTELEEAGEDTEGLVTSTAQLRDIIQGMTGFDIMKDEDTFKDIYDIIVGIGHEWKNLSDIEQASLLEKLAGKRQGNALSSALNNISMIEDAYNTATNAAGSAMREQEKYEQSIQFSLDRLSASFQEFSNTALDSGFIKNVVDSGNTLTNVLNTIVDEFGLLMPLLSGGAITAFIKNFDWPWNKGCLKIA